ncbi:CASH domain-dontaining protein [Candidatus Methanophagaceae archaeon]|nr:CASH domain-dontaining protein [Methanophagales archaeon]
MEGNIVNGKPLVYLEDASGYKVEDAGQVILVNCNNITVENLDLSNTSVGVELLEAEECIISNNTLSNNDQGIRLSSSSNNSFTGNSLSNNIWYGIYIYSSSNNSFIGNSVCNHTWDVICLFSSSNNTITGNTVCNNNYGICLSSSSNNKITGNTVCNNGEGIWFFSSSNNRITGNIVCNNGKGICFYSSNNKIFLNNFINNTANAFSFSFYDATNIWNSTDEITYTCNGSTRTNYLGNYWSDYKEKYPNAKEIGCGIWDTPYSIYLDHDFHPLIQPWENYFAPAASIFDTGTGTYPSIKGTHEGTITPSRNINVSKLYTYPCAGTGGHTESIKLEENGTVIANGTWDGYHEDWHNITLYNVTDGTHSVTLLQDHEYNYTIRIGSYPQILHAASKEVTGGTITCTSFVDANGKRYSKMIPAIRLE